MIVVTLKCVIPIWNEVEYFKEYEQKLNKISGAENANKVMHKVVFIVSTGNNDLKHFSNDLLFPKERGAVRR